MDLSAVHPSLTRDGSGYVYWNGTQVEHYSFRDDAEEAEAAAALAQTCEHLEALRLPVNTSTAVWYAEWFAHLHPGHPYRPLLLHFRDFVEGHGHLVRTGREKAGRPFAEKWTGEAWEELPDLEPNEHGNLYHALRAAGYSTPQLGQGEHNGIVYAPLAAVVEMLERYNVRPCDLDTLRVFLRSIYKHKRFEGRDEDPAWNYDGHNYTDGLVQSKLGDIERRGYSAVSHHDAARGEAVYFGPSLYPVPDDRVANRFLHRSPVAA